MISPTSLPLKAIIRIRIPLNRPKVQHHAEKDDETPEDVDEGAGTPSPGSARAGSGNQEHQQLSTHPDEDTTGFPEFPIEDRALFVTNVNE